MKAVVMEGPEQFAVIDRPVPLPQEDEVVIQIHSCSVCGSDLSIYKMGLPGRILGHEFSGTVYKTGSNVKNWHAGDRVAVEPQLVCGECHWCKTGQYNLCDALQYSGLASDGGFAEYAVVPSYQLHKLSDSVSFEHGALMEPLAVALRGVQRSGMKQGDTVAVFGCGALGMFSILWAKLLNAGMIIASDTSGIRLEAISSLADHTFDPSACDIVESIQNLTGQLGADIVLECSGNARAQTDAVNTVRKSGTVVLLGINYESVDIPLMPIITREITVKGSLGYRSLTVDGEFARAITASASGEIDLSSVPITTYSLEETGKAFKDSVNGTISKAVVTVRKE